MEIRPSGRHIDYHDLSAFEAVAIGSITVMSIFAGVSWATLLTMVV
jgi:hypothetical protein